jgi:hypothetical protein
MSPVTTCSPGADIELLPMTLVAHSGKSAEELKAGRLSEASAKLGLSGTEGGPEQAGVRSIVLDPVHSRLDQVRHRRRRSHAKAANIKTKPVMLTITPIAITLWDTISPRINKAIPTRNTEPVTTAR